MHPLILKYKTVYQEQAGSPTEKVKKILMHHAHSWVWAGSETLVADLIDDPNITADDIVDFLVRSYEDEGGNEEFHYAVRALQTSLRKAQLASIHSAPEVYTEEEEVEKEDGFDNDIYLYLRKGNPSHRRTT